MNAALANEQNAVLVSVIIPIYNGEQWIDECFASILEQDILQSLPFPLELSVFDDSSTDRTQTILVKWSKILSSRTNIRLVVNRGCTDHPKGVGFAKNEAVRASSGKFLCFQDIDDIMLPCRLSAQLNAALSNPNAIIGSRFLRDPPDSTKRFTFWANYLDDGLLTTQIYTSHGPTIIMPTWFCSRNVFDRVGKFSEAGKGTPEDLIFFYKHIDQGGDIIRVNKKLLVYRYHPSCTTYSITEETLWKLRMERLQSRVLCNWSSFAIWNAGKQGRKFYNSLLEINQQKVIAFCDVDEKKIGKFYRPYKPKIKSNVKIPIFHFKDCPRPFVVCVKLGLTNGQFEENLKGLNLIEDHDFVMFS